MGRLEGQAACGRERRHVGKMTVHSAPPQEAHAQCADVRGMPWADSQASSPRSIASTRREAIADPRTRPWMRVLTDQSTVGTRFWRRLSRAPEVLHLGERRKRVYNGYSVPNRGGSMKRCTLVTVVVLACAFGVIIQASTQAKPNPAQPEKTTVNVSGKWDVTLEMSMGTATPGLELKQDGAKITGTYTGRYGSFPLDGTLKGRTIAFSFTMSAEGQTVSMSYTGEVAADALSMKGTASLGEMGDATWSAKKQQ
jgi:hypothetical protein